LIEEIESTPSVALHYPGGSLAHQLLGVILEQKQAHSALSVLKNLLSLTAVILAA